jgi:hypothetical protein
LGFGFLVQGLRIGDVTSVGPKKCCASIQSAFE